MVENNELLQKKVKFKVLFLMFQMFKNVFAVVYKIWFKHFSILKSPGTALMFNNQTLGGYFHNLH